MNTGAECQQAGRCRASGARNPALTILCSANPQLFSIASKLQPVGG
jgi:hypothetical protein